MNVRNELPIYKINGQSTYRRSDVKPGAADQPYRHAYSSTISQAAPIDSPRLSVEGAFAEQDMAVLMFVAIPRAVRNVLLDDLGENERLPGAHYPAVEAAEQVIRQKRRAQQNPRALVNLQRGWARIRAQKIGSTPGDDS